MLMSAGMRRCCSFMADMSCGFRVRSTKCLAGLRSERFGDRSRASSCKGSRSAICYFGLLHKRSQPAPCGRVMATATARRARSPGRPASQSGRRIHGTTRLDNQRFILLNSLISVSKSRARLHRPPTHAATELLKIIDNRRSRGLAIEFEGESKRR